MTAAFANLRKRGGVRPGSGIWRISTILTRRKGTSTPHCEIITGRRSAKVAWTSIPYRVAAVSPQKPVMALTGPSGGKKKGPFGALIEVTQYCHLLL